MITGLISDQKVRNVLQPEQKPEKEAMRNASQQYSGVGKSDEFAQMAQRVLDGMGGSKERVAECLGISVAMLDVLMENHSSLTQESQTGG